MKRTTLGMTFGAAILGMASLASAAFAPGNLVVSRMGDGTAALSSAAAQTTIVEYDLTPSSAPISLLPLASGPTSPRLVNSGSATSEGALTLSLNGQYLTIAGYDAAAGTASVATAAGITRNVAVIDSLGNTAYTGMPGAYTANNIRSAASTDGTAIWTGGTSNPSGTGGVWFVNNGGAGLAQTTAGAVNNVRNVNIYNGNVYVSSASGTNVGINIVSGGLATSGPQTITQLPGTGVSGTGTPSPYDFWFADATTLYVADDRSLANGGGLQKWLFNAGLNTWQLAYTLSGQLTAGLRGLAGAFDVTGAPILYAITAESAANKLVTVTDLGPASSFTTLQTAGTNFIFRGVDFAPVPEPTTIALLGLGVVFLRRKHA